MRVVVQSARYAKFAFVFFGLLGGGIVAWRASEGDWWAFGYLLASIGAITGAFHVLILRRRNKAIVGPNGIVLVSLDGETKEFSWDEVDSASYNRFGGDAKLHAADGRSVETITYEFFGSEPTVKKFIAAVNEWKTGSDAPSG
jgi:hypothetical protein